MQWGQIVGIFFLFTATCCQSLSIFASSLNSSQKVSTLSVTTDMIPVTGKDGEDDLRLENGTSFRMPRQKQALSYSKRPRPEWPATVKPFPGRPVTEWPLPEWPQPGWPENSDDNCEKVCDQVDEEGTQWTACVGYATRNCSGDSSGWMSWYCRPSGEFFGQPSYKNCSTKWISEAWEDLFNLESLSYENATIRLQDLEAKTEMGQNPSNSAAKYYGHEMGEILDLAYMVVRLVKEKHLDECENLTDLVMTIYDNVYINMNLWGQLSRNECTKLGTDFLNQTEGRLLALSTLVFKGYPILSVPDVDYLREYKNNQFKPALGVMLRQNDDEADRSLIFPFDANVQEDSYIELPHDWMAYANDDSSTVSFVGMQIGPSDANYMFPADDKVYEGNATNYYSSSSEIKEDKIVNGNILSFSFGRDEGQRADVKFNKTGVRIVIKHNVTAWGDEIQHIRRKLHPGEARKAVRGSAKCSFWVPENLTWSTDGCVLVRVDSGVSICECFHLTAFALLMDLHDYVGRDIGLEILTWILVPLSIFCLLLTVLILSCLRTIGTSPRTIITKHLSACLAIAMILMLTLMDRHHVLTNKTTCTVTAVVIHYFLLCAFMWMCFEGILLYRMVVHVFESGHDYMIHQAVAAYGAPLIVVSATLIASAIKGEVGDAYGGDAFCWLEGNYIWAFLGPISIILAVNFMILIISLRTAHKLASNNLSSHRSSQKKGSQFVMLLRGSFSTATLLGVTWISGYFMFLNNATVSNTAAYIFTVLNTAQGIFLFTFHCLLNAKVREALGLQFLYISQSNSISRSNLKANSSSETVSNSEKKQSPASKAS